MLVLAGVVKVPNLGDPLVNASSAFSPTTINITSVVTQIQSSPSLTTLANAIAAEIASGYNAGATTPSLGSASGSASVASDVAAISTGVSLLPTTTTTGTVAAINITPLGAVLTSIGATQQFTATPVDSNGKTVSGVSITWATSDATVATVNNTGLATLVSASNCTITATGGGITGSVALVGCPPKPGVDVSFCVSGTP